MWCVYSVQLLSNTHSTLPGTYMYIWQCLSPLCVWQQSAFTDIIITMLLMLYCNICTTAVISVTWAENMTLDSCNLQLASLLLLWLCLSVSVGKFKFMYACMTSIVIENIRSVFYVLICTSYFRSVSIVAL